MPIFEYVCAECGHKFEKLILSGRRATEIRCPACNSAKVEKAISTFGMAGSSGGLGAASGANCAPSG
ncbi:MAG: zinc ribbon domain-containing protein [Anaerolineae bacterium]|nr:zinc ribbon domain-containing protein [Anaerolineae bacterium]